MKELSIVFNGSDFTIRYERKQLEHPLTAISEYTVYFDDLRLTELLGSPFKFDVSNFSIHPYVGEKSSEYAYQIAKTIATADGFFK